jgi:hypothetical protein
MTKSCSSEAMYSSIKSFMNLVENHFQATKWPNRGFVDAIYQRVEVFKTIEESHFQADKMPNRGSVNNR